VCKLELRTKGEIENDKIYARTVCGETVGKSKREPPALYSEREGIISGLNHLGGGVGVNALWKERSVSEGSGWMRRRLRSAFSTFMPRKTFSAETNSPLGAR
jgi:hypothetical protein